MKERRTDSLGARRERESHSNPRSAKPTAEQPLDNPAKGRAASSVRPKGTTENVAERVEPVAKVESQEVAQRSNLPAKASTAAAQPAAAKPVGNAQRETAKINDPDAKVKAREVASPPQAKSAPQPAAPPPAQRAEAATKIAPAKEKADAPATQRPNAEQPRHDSVVAKPAAKLKGETHAREHEAPRKADNPLEKVAVTAEGAADKAERTDPEAPRNSQAAAHQNAAASRVTTPPRETEHAKKQQVEAPQVAIAEQPDAVRQAEPKRIREPRVSTSTASEAKPTATGAAPIAKAAETPQIVPTVPGVATAAPPSATTQTVATTVKSEATVEGARPSGNTSAATENAAAPTTSGVEPHEKSRGATAEGGKTANVKRPISDQQQEVERVRLVQRVAKALQTAQDRGGTLRIRLTPPELGALKIELIVRDGALSAKLEAETPAAKQAILENLPALRERLTAQEIKIERFDVDLMQQSDHSGGERQSFADADTAREHTAQRQATWNNERGGAKASGAKPETSIRAPLSSGRLNVLA